MPPLGDPFVCLRKDLNDVPETLAGDATVLQQQAEAGSSGRTPSEKHQILEQFNKLKP